MKKILLFGNATRVNSLPDMQTLLKQLKQHNIEVMVESAFGEFLKNEVNINIDGIDFIDNNDIAADMALSFGGDGTFLNTAARIGSTGIPILGINTGHLGFLADITQENFTTFVNELINQKYKIEQRTLLHATSNGEELLDFPFALNEIAVLKQETSSMISITTTVNNEPLNTYKADGLLIATPTGSTAYSMSVGGPIVAPTTPTIIVTPIAPHSLTARPLILPDNCEIHLKVDSRTQSYLAAFDGRSQTLNSNTEMTIRKAHYQINIVRPNTHTFFNTLKTKLMWGADSRL